MSDHAIRTELLDHAVYLHANGIDPDAVLKIADKLAAWTCRGQPASVYHSYSNHSEPVRFDGAQLASTRVQAT